MQDRQTSLTPDELKEIWVRFFYGDEIDPRLPSYIAESWRKCKAAGIDPTSGGTGVNLDENTFQSVLAENRVLIEVARPIMNSVYEVIQQTHSTLTLTDSVGYVLEALNDEESMVENERSNFVPGCRWDQLSVGTNGISVALDNDMAVQLRGAEHYCVSHQQGTCSAVPIHNPDGELIGCLNLSDNTNLNKPEMHVYALGLVKAAVCGIEGKLAFRRSMELMRASMENASDIVILLGQDFYPIWGNRAAKQWFRREKSDLFSADFRTVLPDLEWRGPWKGEKFFANDVRAAVGERIQHYSIAVVPLIDLDNRVLSVTLKKQKHLIASTNKMQGNRADYTFQNVFTRDSRMQRVLALAQKYAKYDGNILIDGESGTGKELIAQAIHNAGRNAAGPFVIVNCASLIRERLLTDMFGRESSERNGEGYPGKFELANHGTLFLDEVAEIPLELQSKLLRAVESHAITRVGGTQTIPLDIRIICATNHKLEEDVTNKSFREELFFRLNILRLTIPPLRERRGDIPYCAERFLDRLNMLEAGYTRRFSPEFLAALLQYDWPGNVRELQNSIERAFYTSNGPILTSEDLNLNGSLRIHPQEEAVRAAGDEEAQIRTMLEVCGGDVDAAASRLGMSRATLYRRLKKYQIHSTRRTNSQSSEK